MKLADLTSDEAVDALFMKVLEDRNERRQGNVEDILEALKYLYKHGTPNASFSFSNDGFLKDEGLWFKDGKKNYNLVQGIKKAIAFAEDLFDDFKLVILSQPRGHHRLMIESDNIHKRLCEPGKNAAVLCPALLRQLTSTFRSSPKPEAAWEARFPGRAHLVHQVRESLSNPGSVCFITGEPGIGKSYVADMALKLLGLRAVRVDASQKLGADVREEIYRWLSKDGFSYQPGAPYPDDLVIDIDGAGRNDPIPSVLDEFAKATFVVTSVHQRWDVGSRQTELIHLEPFDAEQVQALVDLKKGLKASSRDVEALCTLLGGLPLGIELALSNAERLGGLHVAVERLENRSKRVRLVGSAKQLMDAVLSLLDEAYHNDPLDLEVLRAAAVCDPDRFSARLIAELVDVDVERASDVLEAWIDRSAIRPNNTSIRRNVIAPCYMMNRLLRDCLVEQQTVTPSSVDYAERLGDWTLRVLQEVALSEDGKSEWYVSERKTDPFDQDPNGHYWFEIDIFSMFDRVIERLQTDPDLRNSLLLLGARFSDREISQVMQLWPSRAMVASRLGRLVAIACRVAEVTRVEIGFSLFGRIALALNAQFEIGGEERSKLINLVPDEVSFVDEILNAPLRPNVALLPFDLCRNVILAAPERLDTIVSLFLTEALASGDDTVQTVALQLAESVLEHFVRDWPLDYERRFVKLLRRLGIPLVFDVSLWQLGQAADGIVRYNKKVEKEEDQKLRPPPEDALLDLKQIVDEALPLDSRSIGIAAVLAAWQIRSGEFRAAHETLERMLGTCESLPSDDFVFPLLVYSASADYARARGRAQFANMFDALAERANEEFQKM